jgi:hypothetical protein
MKRNFLTGTKKVVTAFLAMIFLGILTGCRFYYKVQTINKITSKEMKKYYPN